MQAILLAAHPPCSPECCGHAQLVAVGHTKRGNPKRFDANTESVLRPLKVDLESGLRHSVDFDGVELWTYRMRPIEDSTQYVLFELIGEPEAVGRFLYHQLSFDEYVPEHKHWVNDAA